MEHKRRCVGRYTGIRSRNVILILREQHEHKSVKKISEERDRIGTAQVWAFYEKKLLTSALPGPERCWEGITEWRGS